MKRIGRNLISVSEEELEPIRRTLVNSGVRYDVLGGRLDLKEYSRAALNNIRNEESLMIKSSDVRIPTIARVNVLSQGTRLGAQFVPNKAAPSDDWKSEFLQATKSLLDSAKAGKPTRYFWKQANSTLINLARYAQDSNASLAIANLGNVLHSIDKTDVIGQDDKHALESIVFGIENEPRRPFEDHISKKRMLSTGSTASPTW